MRYAIYFTPSPEHPLARQAAAWLGRDAFSGAASPSGPHGDLSAAEIAFHTASARRYGFHATIKAPFRLMPGATEASLVDALDRYCAAARPVRIPSLVVRQLDGFFALVPEKRVVELDEFAADVVRAFDRFRVPTTDSEIARRNPDSLSPAELQNLHQWGYPYVFDAFRFHMTLSGRVSGADAARLERAIAGVFAPFIGQPLDIASLALFVEPEPGAPFTVRSFHTLDRVLETSRIA